MKPWLWRAVLAVALGAAGCGGDDDDDDGGDGDADSDADVDGDADGDGDACSLDCGGTARALPYDQQSAIPTCEDAATQSGPPEILNIERDAQDRVIHWEVTLRYENNHQFVVRYDVASFCGDGTIESLQVAAESFDPLGTWSCDQFFICDL